MLHVVAVQEFDRRADLNGHHVRLKQQRFLVHHSVLSGRRERFARDRLDINDGTAFAAGDLPGNNAGACD